MLYDVTTTASGEGFAGLNSGAYTEFCIYFSKYVLAGSTTHLCIHYTDSLPSGRIKLTIRKVIISY